MQFGAKRSLRFTKLLLAAALILVGLLAFGSQKEVAIAAVIAQKPENSQAATATLKQETRAVWSWAGRRARARADVDALVAQIDRARLNVVLIQIYKDGTAFFEPSHTRFPKAAERLPNQTPFVDETYRDALTYLIAIRNERRADDDPTNDFEVHAWFAVHSGGRVEDDARWPAPDRTAPYMLNALFPEFRLKYGDYYTTGEERYMDHAVSVVQQPRFQAYITDLIAGVMEDYDVDGVHLDFIRTGGICFNNEALDYPGKAYDYPGCQEDYKAWTLETYGRAYTLWEDTNGSRMIEDEGSGRVTAWLEHSMDRLVKRIHDEVRAVDPALIISVAAVFTVPGNDEGRSLINGQAAWHWLDQGWIDVAFPTFYSTTARTIEGRVALFRQGIDDEQAHQRVFPGLAVHDVERARSRRAGILVNQLKVLLQPADDGECPEAQVQGVALFRAEYLDDRTIQQLAKGPFREAAAPFWGK